MLRDVVQGELVGSVDIPWVYNDGPCLNLGCRAQLRANKCQGRYQGSTRSPEASIPFYGYL